MSIGVHLWFRSNGSRTDLVDGFARERLQINERRLAEVLTRFRAALPRWRELLERSFLSTAMKQSFLQTIEDRSQRVLF